MEDVTPEKAIYQVFGLPNGKKARIKRPSVGDIEKVNLESAAYASKMIKDGRFITKQELHSILEGRTDSQSALNIKMEAMAKKLKILEEKYDKVEDPEQRAAIVEDMQKLQSSVMDSLSDMGSIYGIAIEPIIDQHKRLLLMQTITVNEDGTLYWPSLDDLLKEEDIDTYNIISLRFSEAIGLINLTDEQRDALGFLINGVESPLNVDNIVDETEDTT